MAKKKSEEILEKLLSRKEFQYHAGGDALYRQYRDRYQDLGRKAMEDTVGKVTAQTGGYGNSYAQTAGQQTYGEYMKALSDKVPELYTLALETYTRQGSRLREEYDLLKGQEDAAYQKERDEKADAAQKEQQAYDRFLEERNYNYKVEQDAADRAQAMREAEAEQQRWQAEFEEAKRQFALRQTGSASASGSGSGGKQALTDAQVKQIIAYGEKGDRKGLRIYLASLQESGRITQAEADWLYRQYWGGGVNKTPMLPVTRPMHTR